MNNFKEFKIDFSLVKVEELNFSHITDKWRPILKSMGITKNKDLQNMLGLFIELFTQYKINSETESNLLPNSETQEITYIKELVYVRCKRYTTHQEVKTYLDELTGDIIYKIVDRDGNEITDYNTLKNGYLSTTNLIKIFGTDFYNFLITNKFRTETSNISVDIKDFIQISDYVYINDIKYKCIDGSKCESLVRVNTTYGYVYRFLSRDGSKYESLISLNDLNLKSYCPESKTLYLTK